VCESRHFQVLLILNVPLVAISSVAKNAILKKYKFAKADIAFFAEDLKKHFFVNKSKEEKNTL
jgi:hypothetical protein